MPHTAHTTGHRIYFNPVLPSPICMTSFMTVPYQVLSSERRFRKLTSYQSKEVWANRDQEVIGHQSLRDLKIGVLGLGQMGTQIARTFKVCFVTPFTIIIIS